jgi:replicative DNA helicase Mcm
METQEIIDTFRAFAELYKLESRVKVGKPSIEIGFIEIAEYDMDLANWLLKSPEDTIKAFQLVMQDYLQSDTQNFKVRIRDLPLSSRILIREIRGNLHYGKLISIEGRIKSKSKVRPKITVAKFECPSCGEIISILCFDNFIAPPTRCSCGRKGKFRFLQDQCVKSNTFIISLQEPEDMVKVGSDLQTLSCVFKDDLCEFEAEQQLYQGCRVILNGILKEVVTKVKGGMMKATVDHYFDIVSIQQIEGDFSNIEITPEDEQKIKEFANKEDALEILSEIIFSPIFGYDNVKQALVLAMFSGNTFTERRLKTRGLIHILLIGDPGSAKTDHMLLLVKYSPKAMYVNVAGGAASAAGMTSTVTKDELTGEWTFSAGAIPMMHKGMIMIDEIGELPDSKTLQECMEQLTVSIAKANIQATLLAQTTVIAACNPRTGRFDPYKNIYEQIDMAPPLVNRFDLIFPFKDLRNVDRDGKIADAILSRHKEKTAVVKIELLTPELIKKWVIYSQNIVPELPEDVAKFMKEKYVEIRNRGSQDDSQKYRPVPITARQLQAMIRIAQAYCKIRLIPKITKEIAKFAVQLVIGSLETIGVDPETGELDIQGIEGSIRASKRNKMSIIREIIYKAKDLISYEEILKQAEENGITELELIDLMETLSRTGDIIQPRKGLWRMI